MKAYRESTSLVLAQLLVRLNLNHALVNALSSVNIIMFLPSEVMLFIWVFISPH